MYTYYEHTETQGPRQATTATQQGCYNIGIFGKCHVELVKNGNLYPKIIETPHIFKSIIIENIPWDFDNSNSYINYAEY